ECAPGPAARAPLRGGPVKVSDTTSPAIRTWSIAYARAAHQVLEESAPIVEARGKREHRWRNQTGAAEANLQCEVFDAGGRSRLSFFHGVSYGKYLETMQHGRFAVLYPTLRSEWPRIMARLRARLRRVSAQ